MKQISLLPEPDSAAPLALERIDIGSSIWGCDYGSGYFHVWNGIYKRLTPDEFALLRFAAAGDVIVIENAHLQPKKKSLAQVYDIKQLLAIKQTADERGVSIRLWFHSQTPKWRAMLDMGDKSDEVDAQTVFEIVQRVGLTGLQYFNPRCEYPERIQWAHEQIDDMNNLLNIARIDYKANNCPAVQLFMKGGRHGILSMVWKHHLETDRNLADDCLRWFLGPDSFRQGISLWAALIDYNGNSRRYQGKEPGVKFVMNELLRMRPNHFRGGVARSNLMYYGFRNQVIGHLGIRKGGKLTKRLHELDKKQKAMWLAYRQRYRRAMVVTLHAMKQYINERSVV